MTAVKKFLERPQGIIFGRLVTTGLHRRDNSNLYIECLCSCGSKKFIYFHSLQRGLTKSCGCLRAEESSKNPKGYKHGHAPKGNFSKEYRTWHGMLQRCCNKNGKVYKNYGGRGIKVCKRWLSSFENFYSDMGDAPTKFHSLDRINNERGYSAKNCRWATAKEQSNNTRVNLSIRPLNINGKVMSVKDWLLYANVTRDAIYGRIKRNKPSTYGRELNKIINKGAKK